jgi:DNA polymerase-3 subunit gamma/tau
VHRVRLRALVPAGAAAVTEKAPRAFRLSPSAPNGCQGVTFTASATVVAAIVDDDDAGGRGDGGGAGTTAGGPDATAGGPDATPGGPGATAGGAGAAAGRTSGRAGQGAGWAAASVPGVLAQTGAPLLPLTGGGVALALAGYAAVRLTARRRKLRRPLL